MTLATADEAGRPWASPVFYAAEGYRDLLWISSPDTTHSRNIAARPELSIVVFGSQQPPGTGAAVYMRAIAEELKGAAVARGLEVYPGPADRGGRPMESADVAAPSAYRLYRARVSEHSMLCPRDGGSCDEHGLAFDHRTTVAL
jgi:Pyridoxamine 5'-phosphate oxidase